MSPHFDDVPLSLGESLRSGSLSRHDVRVRVVFGRTNWTSWVHPTPSRASVVSLWRRLEETAAGAAFRYRWTAAGWQEVVLRDGALDPASFLDPTAGTSNDPLVSELRSWLRMVAAAPAGTRRRTNRPGASMGSRTPRDDRADLILVPAGLGGHLDHRIVATAASSLVDSLDVPIGFYEDRPYSAYLAPAERVAHLSRLVGALEPTTLSAPVRSSTQWLARLCYPSQMTGYFTEAMELDRLNDLGETVWFRPGRAPEWLGAS